ncbi:hypothetical protein E0H26_11665 [Micromonospora zingiberis]|uniref:Uncharacterized protein n=1 Tax=Micromonospora zingiberis TaxID=2053011 RepID=A0A4R0GPF7_9ACTN|nr:hypothetical protein [Micromonospora zingiberis]TCB97569.1 hypothetical protein E0H26_11665 [Micromonospora zingiberis]
MYPHDPHKQQYPPQPPPVVYVQQQPPSKATAMGVWAIFLWIAGPAILIVLCCVGCFATGFAATVLEGVSGGSPSPSP